MLPFITMTNHPLDDAAEHERVSGSKSLTEAKRIAAFNQVFDELKRACELFPPMRSAHEGWATLFEEVDELWDEVRLNPKTRDPKQMLVEAKQTAAMAIRFMLDVCGDQINLPGKEGVTRKDRREGKERRQMGRIEMHYAGTQVQVNRFCSIMGKGPIIYDGPERRRYFDGGNGHSPRFDRRKSAAQAFSDSESPAKDRRSKLRTWTAIRQAYKFSDGTPPRRIQVHETDRQGRVGMLLYEGPERRKDARSGKERRQNTRRSNNRAASPLAGNRVQVTLFRSENGCQHGTVVYEGPQRRGANSGRRRGNQFDRRKS